MISDDAWAVSESPRLALNGACTTFVEHGDYLQWMIVASVDAKKRELVGEYANGAGSGSRRDGRWKPTATT